MRFMLLQMRKNLRYQYQQDQCLNLQAKSWTDWTAMTSQQVAKQIFYLTESISAAMP